jgi:hypothetical protein
VERNGLTIYITILVYLDRSIPTSITTLHLLADNVSVHHSKLVC